MSNFLKQALAAITPSAKKTPPAASAATEKKPGPDPKAPTVLLAWATPGFNPHLLTAYKPGTDPSNPNNLVSVNVRSNANFLRHMKLNAMHVEGTTYDLVGPLPRWKGRW